MCAGRAKEYPFRLGTGGRRPKGIGHIQFKGEGESRTHSGGTNSHEPVVSSRRLGSRSPYSKGWLYATHQTLPTMPSMARVDGRGLWRATLRPDIEHKPSEWGRVIVFLGRATNDLWLLAVAKPDGVNDYPNCRSGLSALDGVLRFALAVRTIGRVGSASLPLTLILYHT